MIKSVLFVALLATALFSFKIEPVDKPIADEASKNGRKILEPMEVRLLEPFEGTVLEPFQNRVLEPYDPVATAAKKKQEAQIKQAQQKQKEKIKSQFASKDTLVEKEKKDVELKVSSEVADFFESINQDENKPVNME